MTDALLNAIHLVLVDARQAARAGDAATAALLADALHNIDSLLEGRVTVEHFLDVDLEPADHPALHPLRAWAMSVVDEHGATARAG